MVKYEITGILPEGSDEKKLTTVIEEHGGKIQNKIDLGIKKFAFPIKKQTSGHYVFVQFEIEKENLAKLENDPKLKKDLIRYLIVGALRDTKELKPVEKAAIKETKTAEPEVKVPEAVKESPPAGGEKPIRQLADVVPAKAVPEAEKPPAKVKKAPTKPKAQAAAKLSPAELDKKLEELVKE